MCFNTKIDDPTQQPIRISQSAEARNSEVLYDVTKERKWSRKSSQPYIDDGSKGNDAENATELRKKSSTGAESVPSNSKPKSKRRGDTHHMTGYSMDFGATF
ncbi:uncharacterized protein Z518_09001 [Rhinocladiella mackenziei CBS 650.93]|uniref:Uncharacterized protein n=1 Tax=Rhinocladiella mackenziei CBS 650.93 TaxID=1442369 RepID=A0A0D2IDG3_9EURO|nr:uncharacterized protein Z518_09001 [Rhinocladiella mackenziei CBS 650.93]KIX01276.1 hypothetical protein Z518_09001 [Rhinocladiella mackenziei CBS 650.93]